ncbi:ATP-dependent DNA ligase [Ralstonia phage Reminis]|uniref:ATP-dependent DNA ligase n=1 Tax=Ralstonia phage Reminis TaxID=2662139 RepID=A0A5Q2UCI5_9CAUD|nr:ATP-dependent DNA ligase [Ralstonia phage Reminis]
MNVFEFLGLPANHRPKNKVVQLVKHYREVPASRKSYPLIGQPKKDGVYAMLVVSTKDSVTRQSVFGRTGEELSCTDVITQTAWPYCLADGVYIGELLSKHPCSLEELSGVVNPNRVNPLDDEQLLISQSLYVAWHDVLTLQEFISGKSKTNYHVRYNRLFQYFEGTELLNDILPISIIYDESSKDLFTQACLDAGEEGAVYKVPSEDWVAGHKGYRAMKEVGEVTYDLMCVGIEEGTGKYAGLVANMFFRWKGCSTIKAMPGKGHTHESCRKMYLDPQLAIGRIWKVKGLCNSSKGKVRLPKVEEERHDKVTPDY